MPRPFQLDGAEQRVVTPSERVGGGTRRGLEMLESVLASGGLVLLRGEGSQARASEVGSREGSGKEGSWVTW